jgi:hypothetical protein
VTPSAFLLEFVGGWDRTRDIFGDHAHESARKEVINRSR